MDVALERNLSSAPHWWHVKRLFPSIAMPAECDAGIADVNATLGTIGGGSSDAIEAG